MPAAARISLLKSSATRKPWKISHHGLRWRQVDSRGSTLSSTIRSPFLATRRRTGVGVPADTGRPLWCYLRGNYMAAAKRCKRRSADAGVEPVLFHRVRRPWFGGSLALCHFLGTSVPVCYHRHVVRRGGQARAGGSSSHGSFR